MNFRAIMCRPAGTLICPVGTSYNSVAIYCRVMKDMGEAFFACVDKFTESEYCRLKRLFIGKHSYDKKKSNQQ